MCKEIWVTSTTWHVSQAAEDEGMLLAAVASCLNESRLCSLQKWLEVGLWIQDKDEYNKVQNQNICTDAMETKRHT